MSSKEKVDGRYVPIGKNVVLRKRDNASQQGGIHIPDSIEFDEWVIHAVGDNCKVFNDDSVGFNVIIDKFNSQRFGRDDRFCVVHEKNIRVKVTG